MQEVLWFIVFAVVLPPALCLAGAVALLWFYYMAWVIDVLGDRILNMLPGSDEGKRNER